MLLTATQADAEEEEVTRPVRTPQAAAEQRGKRGRPITQVVIQLADLRALASHAVHHDNCSLSTWRELHSCRCGLFALLDRLTPGWQDDPAIEAAM